MPHHPTYREFLQNHYTNLHKVASGLNDSGLTAEARRGLAELAASDPKGITLDERLTAVCAGEAAKDTAELLKLGKRAYDLQKFGLAARLYGEALERDATLVESDDERGRHAYIAANYAALAGTGQALDDQPLDDVAQAKLRRQALHWLQAELDHWTKSLESATPEQRGIVERELRHWLDDVDLLTVRWPAKLAALADDERQEWSALWARVDGILTKALQEPGTERP
jgi:hypothetical protein